MGRRKNPISEREMQMASMFKQGLTLAVIGEHFGITRERVRQLIAKQGLTRFDGGVSGLHLQKIERVAAERAARYQLRYGFQEEEMGSYRQRGVVKAYQEQKRNSNARGIEFRLSFKQWVTIWETSGKYDLRGRGIGKYVMSRIKDEGCYELGNVHIQPGTENSSEAVKKWMVKGKKCSHTGVYHLTPGTRKSWHAHYGSLCIGRFTTEEEAIQARATYLANRTLEA